MHFCYTSPAGMFGIESFRKADATTIARRVNPAAQYLGAVHPKRFPAILAAQPRTAQEFRAIREAAA